MKKEKKTGNMRLPLNPIVIDRGGVYLIGFIINWWSLIYIVGPCNGHYRLDERRSPPYVKSLIHVHPKAGRLTLLEGLHCDNLYYPDTFTVYIESISDRLGQPEYYSMPLKVIVLGKNCDREQNNQLWMQQIPTEDMEDNPNNLNPFGSPHGSSKVRLMEARRWISESYASFAVPTASDFDITPRLCLRRSQLVGSLADVFLPRTIKRNCTVVYKHVSDQRFRIEKRNGDLVAADDICITEPIWKVSILLSISCPVDTTSLTGLQDTEHRLKIAYRRQRLDADGADVDEMARRVRRELRNRSPFFEQHLYVAGVLEECAPPVAVTTVKARDPENGPVTYSMTSLLDSRTQAMFDIDSRTGLVSTRVQLDRELVDVHYFRVTATDDSFPPRSGTTMLQINVLDANDHAPVFEMAEYEASIREGVGIGAAVVTVKATDQDSGKNAEVEYSLASVAGGGTSTATEDERAFKIDPKTGAITTRTALDRETAGVYTLMVRAADQASPQSARKTATATVVVKVIDDNDNYPQFLERAYAVTLNEDIDVSDNPTVAQVTATDADEAQFAIDSATGAISLQKPLDYETARSYRLVIRAQDGGQPPRSNTTQLLVNVKDCNDNAPRFYASLFQESVLENVPVGYSVVKVQAYDADEGANADIMYSLAQRDSQGGSTQDMPLAVDQHTGWIYTIKELDREKQTKYVFKVIAADQGNPPQTAEASVAITVQDVNDNDPVFSPKVYESAVSEADAPGTPVATVSASDPDEDGRLHYEITAGNQRGRFAITSQGGRGLVTIAQPLDYKQERRFILTIQATDSGGRSDTATVFVNVTDANNYAPAFENAPYTATDAVVGTTVLVVSATDNDVGANAQITYSLDAGPDDGNTPPPFSINPQTGAVVTLKQLDRETAAGYLLTVTAKDGGQPPLSDTTDVFSQPAYSASIAEDALVGTAVVQVSATDADAGLNGRVRYQLSEKDQQEGSFVIDPTSGVIRTNKGLDRESTASYELEAYAIDRGSPTLSSSVPVVIRVEDVNDSPPAFDSDKIVLYIAENSPIGSTVSELRAHDPDEGQNAAVQYSIVGGEDAACFSLITRAGSDATAALVTMVELDYESAKKRYELVVRAASPPLRTDAHVDVLVTDVNDNAPQLSDFQRSPFLLWPLK
nr:unnamed protein product [Callosobruchus analis]